MKILTLLFALSLTACGSEALAAPTPAPTAAPARETVSMTISLTRFPNARTVSVQVNALPPVVATVTPPPPFVVAVPAVIGTDTFTMNVYDAAGALIATGTTTATIVAGTANNVTITLIATTS